MKENKNISLICAPFSIGGPNDAAKDGPDALLKKDLRKDLEELGFSVKVIKPPFGLGAEGQGEWEIGGTTEKRIKNIEVVIEVNKWLVKTVSKEIISGYIPLTIGGDHSLAIGTISGIVDGLASLKRKSEIGVLWIDRHFDAHHPKYTPSWRAHGMPVAVVTANKKFDSHPDFQKLLKIGKHDTLPKVKPQNVVQFAIGEKSLVKPKTKWFLMEDIDRIGINTAVDRALDYLLKKVKYIYVAWDIDSMNVTGTGTSDDSQLTLREGLVLAREINKRIREKGKLIGFEIMEVAPRLEKKELKGQTVDWAMQLVTTCFGGNLFNNLSRMTKNINMHA